MLAELMVINEEIFKLKGILEAIKGEIEALPVALGEPEFEGRLMASALVGVELSNLERAREEILRRAIKVLEKGIEDGMRNTNLGETV